MNLNGNALELGEGMWRERGRWKFTESVFLIYLDLICKKLKFEKYKVPLHGILPPILTAETLANIFTFTRALYKMY